MYSEDDKGIEKIWICYWSINFNQDLYVSFYQERITCEKLRYFIREGAFREFFYFDFWKVQVIPQQKIC